MRRTSKKRRHQQSKRSAYPHRSSARKDTSSVTLASKIRATRGWIIAAIVAGLGLSITGAVVSLTHVSADWLGRAIGVVHNNTTPDNADVNAAAGPALSVQVAQGFAEACGGGGSGWVFPKSASGVIATSPAAGPTRDGQTWVSDPSVWGAVEASDVIVQMVASGNSQRAIVLTGIRAHVLRRRPELQGSYVNIEPLQPPVCANAVFQAGTVDLDTSPPTWIPGTSAEMAATDRTAPFKFPYVVSASDPEPFIFVITTKHCDCTWTLELDWVAGSTNGKSIITTATTDLPSVQWGYGQSNGPWRRVS
jgi:hypothetical protein